MKHPGLPAETLLIGSSSSHCNACGRACAPESKTHDVILGWGSDNGSPGCGVEWLHVWSEYTGEHATNAVKDMRPDLHFIDHGSPATRNPLVAPEVYGD